MSIRKVEFQGSDGSMLAARLDLPRAGITACALLAHCFTCSKDIAASRAIAQTLADLGIAVLRFDFTGLGHSKGEFANTNFSSNVDDLVAAADFLRAEVGAPEILIGHSLGGAAVIAAASRIAECKAVVTIGAPAEPGHVLKALGASLSKIRDEGIATVELEGRSFDIKRQFVDDISGRNLSDALANLNRALLVLHAPRDAVVGIDNASAIFGAAKHPKSFVSLDDADHLLSRKADAEYAAGIIATWAHRYVSSKGTAVKTETPEGIVRVTEAEPSGFLQRISVDGRFHLVSDEPESVGGGNLGPTPYQLLAAALGACTSMTMRMYARRKSIALDGLVVDVSHSKSHADDSEDAGSAGSKIDVFKRSISLDGDLTGDERARLLEIADRCPVHRTLEARARIETEIRAEP